MIKLNVIHFQSKDTRRVPLLETYAAFRERIKLEFNSQLGDDNFEIYRFNSSVVDISQRIKVSASNYEDLKREFSESTTSSPFPYVYVWSITNTSNPSPDQKDFEDGKSGSGRSISNSIMCKIGASWACMACGQNFNSCNRRTLEAAHILEIHEQGDYTEEEFNTLLKSCGIILLEDLANLISLCTVCHNDYFDMQLIAINVVDGESNYSWIVKESVLGDAVPNGTGTYADINNKEIHFEYEQQKPPRNLVLHRLKRFHKGNISKSISSGKKLSCKQVCIFSNGC